MFCSALFCRTAQCPFGCARCRIRPESHFCRFRDFHIWWNLPQSAGPPTECHSHTSRQSGSLHERLSAFANLRSTTNFPKIIHAYRVSASGLRACRFLTYAFTRSSCSTYKGRLQFFLSLTTANFAISDSDGSTSLLVGSASKRVYSIYVLDHFVLVSYPQWICCQGLARITSMNAPASSTAYKATQIRVL